MRSQYLALVRHGESEANIAIQQPTEALYYEITGSDVDVGLTPDGRTQAFAAGIKLGQLLGPGNPIDRILLNRFRRIVESADELERALGYKVIRLPDDRLNKRSYGSFWNLTYRGIEVLHPEEWARYQAVGKLLYRPPGGGENYPDVFARVNQVIDEQVLPSRENLVIVTHSVVMLSCQRRFAGLSDEEVVRQYEEQTLPNGQILLFVRKSPHLPFEPCCIC